MKAVLFDFDGPLFDGRDAFQKALGTTVEHFADRFGKPGVHSATMPLHHPQQVIALAYAEFDLAKSDLQAIEAFYREQLRLEEASLGVRPDVSDMLQDLRRQRCSCWIISSRPQDELDRIVAEKGLKSSFDVVIGRSPARPSKSSAIAEAVSKLGCAPEEIVFVGDSDPDFLAAKENGVPYYHAGWSAEPTSVARKLAKASVDTAQDLKVLFSDIAPEPSPPPFPRELREALERGHFAFFAGAGVSVPSGLGAWDSHYVPILRELGAGPLLNDYDLPELLQLIARDDQRARAIWEKFEKSFRGNKQPSVYHHAMLRSNVEHIWTTNYDNLFEKAISGGHLDEYKVVQTDEELRQSFGQQLVVKMHGDFGNGAYREHLKWGMVLLQEHLDLAERERAEIWRLFEDDYRNRSLIFVGVSFRDPTLRRITAAAARNIPSTRYPHYLLMHLEQHPVELMKFRLFRDYLKRYHINVLAFPRFQDIERFVQQVAIAAIRPVIGFCGTALDGDEKLPGAACGGTEVEQMCGLLGRALAHRGFRITSGHGPKVGVPAVDAAFAVAPTGARFYLRRKGTSKFSRTAPAIVLSVDSLDEMRARFIPECDLVFVAGGEARPGEASGTVSEIKRAAQDQIPVLILKQAGGDAGVYADEFLREAGAIYKDARLAQAVRKANEQLHQVAAEQLPGFIASSLPDVIADIVATDLGTPAVRPLKPGRW